MIEIKDLLDKWSGVLLSHEFKIKSISSVLEQIIGIKIKPEDIKIKNNTIYLNIKPIYKNEIFLKKEQIISLLEEILGKRVPKNIR